MSIGGLFSPVTLVCPDCQQEFEGIRAWEGGDVPCNACGTVRHNERMERVQAGRAYTVDTIGGMCPTQAEGRTAQGRPYYFRARHGAWTLEVGEPAWPTDYVEWPLTRHDNWTSLVAQGDDPTEGAMEDDEVLAILDRELADR